MPEQLEEIMKKFHLYLANCEKSAYSDEEVVVSKKRIFALLEELNEAVYALSEKYEATQETKAKAIMKAERQAAEIKEEARERADDIYAASLLYMNDAISQIKQSLENNYTKVRQEYEGLIDNYEEKIKELNDNSQEIKDSLSKMQEEKTYLHLIEQMEIENKLADDLEEEKAIPVKSKLIGEVESFETLAVAGPEAEAQQPEGSVRIQVPDTPKPAEISSRGQKKENKKKDFFHNIISKL